MNYLPCTLQICDSRETTPFALWQLDPARFQSRFHPCQRYRSVIISWLISFSIDWNWVRTVTSGIEGSLLSDLSGRSSLSRMITYSRGPRICEYATPHLSSTSNNSHPRSTSLPIQLTHALSMSAIDHIPDHIVGEILSPLRCPDLAHASLVCRRLFYIAQPLLYMEPELLDRGRSPLPLQAFLRTLLTPGCEALGTHVRRLKIKSSKLEMAPINPDHALFINAKSRYGLKSWSSSPNYQVILLLHLLPRLQFLHIPSFGCINLMQAFEALHDMFQPVTLFPIGLQSLTEIRLGSPSLIDPRFLVALLRLPNLRTLSIPIFGNIEHHLSPCEAVTMTTTINGTSNVTSLDFSLARVPPSSLMRILQIPRTLTKFSYTALNPIASAFHLKDVAMALYPLRGSLHTLHLDFSQLRRALASPQLDSPVCLRDWPALRHLKSSLMPLLGRGLRTEFPPRLVDVLPGGLRTLAVLGDRYWLPGQVADELVLLLEQKDAVVDGLQSAAVSKLIEMPDDMMERVRAACAKADVVLMSCQ